LTVLEPAEDLLLERLGLVGLVTAEAIPEQLGGLPAQVLPFLLPIVRAPAVPRAPWATGTSRTSGPAPPTPQAVQLQERSVDRFQVRARVAAPEAQLIAELRERLFHGVDCGGLDVARVLRPSDAA